jgi:hypothetical protein
MDHPVSGQLTDLESNKPRPSLHALHPANGVSFLLIGEQGALFSELTQKIYLLNQTAAYIWCRLEDGATLDAACNGLIDSGVELSKARKYVRQAIHHWQKLGLLKIDFDVEFEYLPVEKSFNICIAGFNATIRICGRHLAGLLSLFDHQMAPVRDFGHILYVIESDNLVNVFHNRINVICCDATELAPFIKAYITEQIIAQSEPNVVFHAACLTSGNKKLLISGAPGAGKTTLTLSLLKAGFGYEGDDVALIAPNGDVRGISFAPAIKPGAWNIVKQFRPDISDAIVHRRPDGKRVRYLNPIHFSRQHGNGNSVGWIVFIRRRNGPTKLETLGPIETFNRIMNGSYSPGGKLNFVALSAIKHALARARSFELTYSDLAAASDTLVRLCDD